MARVVLNDLMPTPRTRKSHIISEFHLRHFADAEGRIFVYQKGGTTRKSTPRKECVERDYFEYKVGGHPTNYEEWFARTESEAGLVYPKLCQRSFLTTRERQLWSNFIAHLFLRSRKVRDQIGPRLLKEIIPTFDESYLRELQHDLLKQGRLIPFDEIDAASKRTIAQMTANPAFGHLAGIEHSTRTVAESILSRNWFIVDNASEHEFFTSDCPVSTARLMGDGAVSLGHGFSDGEVAIFFPLTPNKFFIASPLGRAWKSPVMIDEVHSFNTITARFAHKAVYCKSESNWIQDVVRSEIDKVVYGVNAFVPTISHQGL